MKIKIFVCSFFMHALFAGQVLAGYKIQSETKQNLQYGLSAEIKIDLLTELGQIVSGKDIVWTVNGVLPKNLELEKSKDSTVYLKADSLEFIGYWCTEIQALVKKENTSIREKICLSSLPSPVISHPDIELDQMYIEVIQSQNFEHVIALKPGSKKLKKLEPLVQLPAGISLKMDVETNILQISGNLKQLGVYTIPVRIINKKKISVDAQLRVLVSAPKPPVNPDPTPVPVDPDPIIPDPVDPIEPDPVVPVDPAPEECPDGYYFDQDYNECIPVNVEPEPDPWTPEPDPAPWVPDPEPEPWIPDPDPYPWTPDPAPVPDPDPIPDPWRPEPSLPPQPRPDDDDRPIFRPPVPDPEPSLPPQPRPDDDDRPIHRPPPPEPEPSLPPQPRPDDEDRPIHRPPPPRP